MTADTARALQILAGCPDGATELALAQHRIYAEVLADLVARKLARVTTDHFAKPRGMALKRYFITPAGMDHATAHQPG